MLHDYLHNHKDFPELIRIVAEKFGITPVLVEKDYWIMHCLYGLQQMNMKFELKGGTSLSKGFCVIHRFSEDIDIRIDPPKDMDVKIGRNQYSTSQIQSRKLFYDWLADNIIIDGIYSIQRDNDFDDKKLFSGGIRLHYNNLTSVKSDLKDGVLLEVGFDDVTPNMQKDISSWAYDYAVGKVELIDNRAVAVLCYDYRYTFVEKLQAISTKFRKQQSTGEFPANFLRHYYDVYCLLDNDEIQKFLSTEEYHIHKKKRFRSQDNLNIISNEAFLLNDEVTFRIYDKAYEKTKSLYYRDRPSFDEILCRIRQYVEYL